MSSLEPFADAIAFAHDPSQDLRTAQTTAEHDLERTAALASAALSPASSAPSSLSAKLAADALQFCASTKPTQGAVAPGFTTPTPRPMGALLSFVLGAAAAGLFVWLATSAAQTAPSAAALRAETLAAAPGLQRQWTPGPSPMRGDMRGDVVWRQEHQDGWLTFRDLPELPADRTYQLWIIDGEREGAPVDGGVFTIDGGVEETLVTIRPALPIGAAKSFVVTVEDRGGVVVSKQEHVVATASL